VATNPPDWTTPPRPGTKRPVTGGTPVDPPNIYIPTNPATDIRSIQAQEQGAVDLSQVIQQQFEATNQLLDTLSDRIKGVVVLAGDFSQSFASTADHIRRSTEATEKLASAQKKVSDEKERGNKSDQNSTFRIRDVATALASGNLQGAIGEAFQGIPGTQGLADKLAERGTSLSEAGVARGGLTGLGLRGAGALASLSGSLMTPAAIYGAYRLFNSVNAQQQQDLRLGVLTGEGRGAGIAAGGINLPIFGRIGGEVGALRGSPFDLVGNKEAMEIVQGVRGAGFRGEDARNTEEAIKGMVNDLGIGVEDAMTIAIPAIKEAGLSTGQLAAQMSTLDDTAKASRTSITDLTKAVGGLITDLSQQSRFAAQQATGTTENLLREFQGTLAGRQPGIFAALQTGPQREALAQLSGFAPFEAYTPQFVRNFQANFNRVLVQLARGRGDADWNLYVQEILLNPLYAQLFGNTPVPAIIDMLKTAWKGSDQGTNEQKFVDSQATKDITKMARDRARGISDNFDQLMRRKKSIFDGPLSNWITGKSGGVARNLIQKSGMQAEQEVASILMNLGLTKEERRKILDPIVKAAQAGDKGGTEKALDAASKIIDSYGKSGEIRVHTTVGFDPRSARMLKTLNTGQVQALRGERGTQGIDIHN